VSGSWGILRIYKELPAKHWEVQKKLL
jgi:hypothetical protein